MSLRKSLKSPAKNSCEIIPFLVKYSGLFNRVFSFVYPDYKPTQCLVRQGSKIRIETACRTSLESIVYILTGKLYPDDFEELQYPKQVVIKKPEYSYEGGRPKYVPGVYKKQDPKESSVETLKILEEYNFIVLEHQGEYDFPGHILAIAKIDSDCYYVLQSYIFEYELEVSMANKKGISKFIDNYFSIFNGTRETWRKEDTKMWEKLTNVNVDGFIGNKIDPILVVSIPNDEEKIDINNKDCKSFALSLLQKSREKLTKANKEEIEEIFHDWFSSSKVNIDTIEQKIKMVVEELKNSKTLLGKKNTISDEGYLIKK